MAIDHSHVPSGFGAFIRRRCPRCRKGPVFKTAPYSIHFQKMHEDCPVCGLHYEIEPGFFWGSMYISYAFTVAVAAIVIVPMYIYLNDPPTWVYIAALVAALVLLAPPMFQYSRLIMLYMFGSIDYDPNAEKKYNK